MTDAIKAADQSRKTTVNWRKSTVNWRISGSCYRSFRQNGDAFRPNLGPNLNLELPPGSAVFMGFPSKDLRPISAGGLRLDPHNSDLQKEMRRGAEISPGGDVIRGNTIPPMPLRTLDLAPSETPIPADVTRFIREADRRIDIFQDACRVPGFVPSDYSTAYRVIRSVAESGLARGRQFCEWGSGFGVIACLAAMLDFDSCGVEVESILVEEARKLADDFELTVDFAAGSYVPRGAEDRVHRNGSFSWFSTEGDYAYEDLGLDLSDMDVVFAYPWPDEEPVTIDLFQRYCGAGALLITFHGGEDFRVRRNRKGGKRGRR